MTDEKEFRDYKLYILDKFKHFEQENCQFKCDIDKLQAEHHKMEVEYAKNISELKSRIITIEKLAETFPTKEQIDARLKDLERYDIESLPGQVGTLKQFQWNLEGKMIAYGSVAGVLAAVATIFAYVYL